MQKFVKLSMSAQAYHSGATYYEEMFLSLGMWEEIKDEFPDSTSIHGMDGKHSEVNADIDVEIMTTEGLKTYRHPEENDGERLFDMVFDYLPKQYDYDTLCVLQDVVEELCEIKDFTISIRKQDEAKVLELIKDYLL